MTNTSIYNFAILDFEASSLSETSWPIEIGISWIENNEVRTWATLIRPDAAWDIDDWSPQSAAVHGIRLSDLYDAPSVPEVADTFYEVLGGRVLVSDAPKFELRWLSTLLHAAGRQKPPNIQDFNAVSFAMFQGLELDLLYETIERRRAPHRAGPDSARLARGWARAAKHRASLGSNQET